MNNPNIIIESDVVESIFRPISLFLNDIDPEVELSLLSVSTRPLPNDSDKTFSVYKFLASNGTVYSFTQYDLSNFLTNGVKLIERLKIQPSKQAKLCSKFMVNKSVPRLTVDGNKMYPLFAFKGYALYKEQLALKNANKADLKQKLFATAIVSDYEDRYYRSLDIDKDIIFYED